MAHCKIAVFFLLLVFSSLSAFSAEPSEKSLLGLREQIMSTEGMAGEGLVRRVLSYREGEQNILLFASQRGDVPLIKQLGAVLPDTRVFQSKDFYKRNAFHLAANYNTALELMKTYAALRLRETTDTYDVFDRRAFKTALINAGDRLGETPIMTQVKAYRYDVAFLYLTKNADLSRKTVTGDTVLHMLVRQCSGNGPRAVDLLESFLRGEPYVVFLKDKQGRTPLDLAKEERARVAFEKIKEVQQEEEESRARNIRIAIRNFFNS